MSTESSHDPLDARVCCEQCGYPLAGLPEARCPECGRAFNPEWVRREAWRFNLLPWEKPDVGGKARRLLLTLWRGCFHPKRYFARAAARSDVRIAKPALYHAYDLLMMVMYIVLVLAIAYAVVFVAEWMRLGNAWKAFRLVTIDEATPLLRHAMRLVRIFVIGLISIGLLAFCVRLSFRKRLGALKPIDLMVLFSPACFTGPLLVLLVAPIILIFDHLDIARMALPQSESGLFFLLRIVYLSGLCLYVGIMGWFCCRELLGLRRHISVGVASAGIAFCLAAYGASGALGFP